jgi:hypothetical protein
MKKLAALLFLVGLNFGGAAAAADQVEIRYIPFNAETFVAITPENITRGAVYTVTLDQDTARLRELSDLIAGARKGPVLDEAKVRARITFPDGRVVFLDQSGGIRRAEGDFDLNDRERNRADALLTEITGAPLSGFCFPDADELAKRHLIKLQELADHTDDVHMVTSGIDLDSPFCKVRIRHQTENSWTDLFVDPDTGEFVKERPSR